LRLTRWFWVLLLALPLAAQERFFATIRTDPPGVRVYQMDGAAQPILLGRSDKPQLELYPQVGGPVRLAFEYDSPLPIRSWLGPACPPASFEPQSACVRQGWTVKDTPAAHMGPYRLPLGPLDRLIEALYRGRWLGLALLAGLLGSRLLRRDRVQLVVHCEPAGAQLTSQDQAVRRDWRGRHWIDRGRLGDQVVVRLWKEGYEARQLSIPVASVAGIKAGGRLMWPPAGAVRLQFEENLAGWELPIGETVGGYQVAERLGEGVSAVVYRVVPLQDPAGRGAALKLLKPEELRGAEVMPRFRREMDALLRLRHPNIPYLLDYGEYRGMPYLVMELLAGKGLDQQPMPLARQRACQVLSQVAQALAYAHKMGVLHRDVKPGNVVLGDDGVVKLTDFGLARAQDSATLTAEGMLLGTPAYMAPETISGQPASAQSDQYSLACLALEVFTGHPPYEGESPLAVAIQHVQEPAPEVSELLPHLTFPLTQSLQRMLAKAPADRLPNLEPFMSALESSL
jgi:hypothetical protein